MTGSDQPRPSVSEGDTRDSGVKLDGGFAQLADQLLLIHANVRRARRNTVIYKLGRWANENGLVVAAGLRLAAETLGPIARPDGKGGFWVEVTPGQFMGCINRAAVDSLLNDSAAQSSEPKEQDQ